MIENQSSLGETSCWVEKKVDNTKIYIVISYNYSSFNYVFWGYITSIENASNIFFFLQNQSISI